MKKLKFILIFWIINILTNFALSQDVETSVQKAMEYYNAEKYDSAAVLFEVALPLIEKKYGDIDTTYYTKQLNYTAKSFENTYNYDKAEYYYLKEKSIYEILHPDYDKNYAALLIDLAYIYSMNGKYDEAESLYNMVMEMDKKYYGETNPKYAVDLNYLADLYYVMGRYDEGVSLMLQATDIDRMNNNVDLMKYARHVDNLGAFYKLMGRYKEADSLFNQALEIVRINNGKNNTDYAYYLNDLADLYNLMGNYKKALPLGLEALKISGELEGENNTTYATYLSTVAILYKEMGRYEQAEILYKQALEIEKRILGENNYDYAIILNKLADLYNEMGEYDKAEYQMIKALDIDKSLLGEDHPNYAIDLNNLASFYTQMGRYEKAVPLLKDAIEITKNQMGEDHPNYTRMLGNLALAYKEMGHYNEAENLLKDALEIGEKNLNENDPNLTYSLNTLGLLYLNMGNYEEAEPLIKRALEIKRQQLGENNPYYAIYLHNLALVYKGMKKFELAEPLFKQSVELARKYLDKSNLNYAKYLNSLARLYQIMKRNEEVLPLNLEAFEIYQYQIKNNTGFLSEKEFKQFLNTFLYLLDIYQSFNYQQLNDYSFCNLFAYNIELSQKGMRLRSALDLKNRILESADTALINAFYDLGFLHKKITKLKNIPPEKRSENLEELEAQANNLEKTLNLKSKDYRQAKEENEITWTNVKQNLKSEEATIEFSSFHFYNGKESTDSILYCAIVIKSNDTIPRMIYLSEETQLNKAIPSSLGTAFKEINSSYTEQSLYKLIWQPLDSLLTGIKTIYFAPSGLLNSVSLAAITCPDNRTLMDKYNLVQLSSTRTLALPEEPEAIKDAVVYGGIKYDTDTTAMLTNAKKYNEKEDEFLAYNRSTTWNNRSGFRYLEGTQKEAEQITEKLDKKGISTTTYSGEDAPEESFIALSGNNSPTLIHISTHGFYYPDAISDENRKKMDLSGSGELRFRYSDDPLLRSGLLMSGANRAWRGLPLPAGVEDGILTAKEVSNMNLMNTELIVLSACQTGQGDVKGSEGVEGLQRGFKMAGVRYIMMSLWEIPDRETTEFMEAFYDNWLGGQEIRDAFRYTQIKMKNKYKDEPFKWAGFVLME